MESERDLPASARTAPFKLGSEDRHALRFWPRRGEMAHGKVLDGPIGLIARPNAIGCSAKSQPQRAKCR
jgi:hypothetical protein